MSFVITSKTAAPFGACALLVALIGGNRLGYGNRGSQSNGRESSYCRCLNPSFIHSVLTPKCSLLINSRGAFRTLRHCTAVDGYKKKESGFTQRHKGRRKGTEKIFVVPSCKSLCLCVKPLSFFL